MRHRKGWVLVSGVLFGVVVGSPLLFGQGRAAGDGETSGRTIVDAHNCYPYEGRWNDRIDRALSSGVPVAIEQDVNLYAGRVVVAHGGTLSGQEPELETYFFARIRPLMEAALKSSDHSVWPLITLNLDFKSEQPELLRAVWVILGQHKEWLSTAARGAGDKLEPIQYGPLLVLNGSSEAQQRVFFDEVPVGGRLLTFGAARTNMRDPAATVEVIEVERATNYRRWWNNPWTVVEPEGQAKAGAWTPAAQTRLRRLVDHAHAQGLWIRFYTLDGATPDAQKVNGWFAQYNFPDLQAAEARWRSAIEDGVDYLASDQYEQVGRLIRQMSLRSVR